VVEEAILLEPDPDITPVHVDMSLKVQMLESSAEGITTVDAHEGRERFIPAESLELVNWEQAYLELIEYKEQKGFANLVVQPDAPRRIIAASSPGRLYGLVADETVVKPESFAGTALLQEAVVHILQKYTDAFYRTRWESWDSNHMVYRTLDESDSTFSFNQGLVKDIGPGGYMVKIQRSESELISGIERLIDEVERLYTEETGKLHRIHFERHLYQPLLVEHGDKKIGISPSGLNKSELQFVRDIKDYWVRERDKSLAGVEVFLLRNLSRGAGIGFFEERGFYPDFILWIIFRKKQHIVFLEPHGMLHAGAYMHDTKARLHEVLPVLAKSIDSRSKRKDITLDSYVVSATAFEDLYKKYDDGTWNKKIFSDKHILFMERSEEYDYIEKLFSDQLIQ
jgi:hypothetical protein